MNVWSTSRLNGRIPLKSEKNPMMMIAVCASDTTPPRPQFHPLNLNAMYAKITMRARMMEITAFLLMSFAIDAPTLSEEMIPLVLANFGCLKILPC